MVIDKSDWHFEVAITNNEKNVRNNKGMESIEVVSQSGTITQLCTIDSLAQG